MKKLLFTALLVGALLGQTPQAPPGTKRDLKIEKEPPAVAPSSGKVAPSATIPRSYALVIGISQYKNLGANLQLHYAQRDAELIYSALISPEGGNFKAENVHMLVNGAATLGAMRHELEDWLPSVTANDDRVLIYFAGHGFIGDDGEGYLAPSDFDLHNAMKSGYGMNTLGSVMGTKIKGKWKVLLTDSCHSGAITPQTSNEKVNQKLLSLSTSLFSLTASRDREQSFESADFGGGHGVFTYYVYQGIEGEADENGDGKVTADELADYVYRNVREATQARQNPTSDKGSFDANMLLAYNPTRTKPGNPPPPKDGTLIFESNMDGVELFVDGNSAGVLKKGEPFRLPGMQAGTHTIKAVKMGYEPDGPRDEIVYPGQESTVKIRILILRRRAKAATDEFDKGVEYYTKGFEQNYKKAAELFRKALAIDPKYSQAALYLGRTLNALTDEKGAAAAFTQAIDADPDYMEARASFAGMLLDNNDTDKAVQQLTVVIQREPDNFQALYLLAEAYRLKEAYPQSIDAARKAIAIRPGNAEAHFWLAESLRLTHKWDESAAEYQQYLKLSNFDSKLAGKLNYYVLGYLIGFGKKTRASQGDIWDDLRSLAYFGLCNCDYARKEYDSAIANCNTALTYDPKDPYAHLFLGKAYAHKAQDTNNLATLAVAEKHLRSMLAINDQMAESDDARKMIASFDAALARK